MFNGTDKIVSSPNIGESELVSPILRFDSVDLVGQHFPEVWDLVLQTSTHFIVVGPWLVNLLLHLAWGCLLEHRHSDLVKHLRLEALRSRRPEMGIVLQHADQEIHQAFA
jgi:hypothetical protein